MSQIDENMVYLFLLVDCIANLELSQEHLVETMHDLDDNTQEFVHHLYEQLNDLAARVVVLTQAVNAMPTLSVKESGAS